MSLAGPSRNGKPDPGLGWIDAEVDACAPSRANIPNAAAAAAPAVRAESAPQPAPPPPAPADEYGFEASLALLDSLLAKGKPAAAPETQLPNSESRAEPAVEDKRGAEGIRGEPYTLHPKPLTLNPRP